MEKSASCKCECKHQPLTRVPTFPPYMSNAVAFWLIQVDAFFRVTRITSQRERLDYFLIHMGSDAALMAVVKVFLEERMHLGESPWASLKLEIQNNLDNHTHQLPGMLYTYEDEHKGKQEDKSLNVL